MPEISLPDIKLPDVKFRDGRLRDMKLPDIDLRDRLPDVDLSKLSLPGALRDISMPEVSMRDMHLPDVHMPDFNLRDVKAPRVDLSGVDLKSLDPRRLDLSGVDPKRLRKMMSFARPAPKSASPLPWVVVAGIGGLFAGWWLATSSMTGPKVRQLAAGLRSRIDTWRSGRAEDTDVEGRTETFWSTEQGWKKEGSQDDAPEPEGVWTDDATQNTTSEHASTASAIGGAESGASAVVGTAYEPAAHTSGSDAMEREG
jgi:hypothetical protein